MRAALLAVLTLATAVALLVVARLVVGACLPSLRGFVPGVGTPEEATIDVARHLAYVSSTQFGLTVMDVTDPNHPVSLGGLKTPVSGGHVSFSGTLVGLIAQKDGTSALQFIDVTTASTPVVRSSLSGVVSTNDYTGVQVVGTKAYVFFFTWGNPGHTELLVMDVSDPTAPSILGRVTLAGSPAAMQVVGNTVYIANGSGLQTVDVTTATAPAVLGSVAILGARHLAVVSGFAYVATTSAVQVVNVQTPSNPTLGPTVSVPALDVVASGTKAYATGSAPATLSVIDITTPTSPSVLASINSQSSVGLALGGTTLIGVNPNIVATQNLGGLYFWNAAPTTPVLIAHVLDTFGASILGLSGSLACVVGPSNGNGIRFVNVANAAAPVVVGSLPGANGVTDYTGCALVGATMYAFIFTFGNPGHTDFGIFDVSNPAVPTLTGKVLIPGSPHDVKVSGTVAYVPNGIGLQLVNISTPSSPTLLGVASVPAARQVALGTGFAFVAADTNGIKVVDVSNTAAPFVAATVASNSLDVALSGTKLYSTAAAPANFLVLDVTTPTAPVVLATIGSGGAQSVDVVGTLAFLGGPFVSQQEARGFVSMYDVSVPTAPRFITQIRLPGHTSSIIANATAGRTAYAADDAGLVDIVQ